MREERDGGHRHLRLQELVLEELQSLLRDDITDPALVDVEIGAVVLSPDYRHARVHFSLRTPLALGHAAGNPATEAALRGSAERALTRATPFLRARLAEAIDMKRVPELRFVFDGVASSG
ncbi:hypothetical protein AKJ09_05472 [Labilithrix luteola]|uniref:Ribosome-binding factor A n=1 Tax=Labilithrix luteola TaxID=1391654 RepID=A0A0K1PZ62_9BACT|nr:ribosome-binding factor A [Labilithrix luteola]AKU98808.1 hypothetical protein AKJ09_05472 [Labilithrix luteola]